jgi:ribosomal protein S6--L-glutamate ligase
MTACFGITRNSLAPNVPNALADACRRLGVRYQEIDLGVLTTTLHPELEVRDAGGPLAVDFLSPTLYYWQDQAVLAAKVLKMQGCRMLNSADASLIADDKAATALVLQSAHVAQMATSVVAPDFQQVKSAAANYGYPTVIKRTNGAQGRWVRLAHNDSELERAVSELLEDGPGALLVQPVGGSRLGESVRVIVTGGSVRAATVRHAPDNEWRSNISGGGSQVPTELSEVERDLAIAAARAVGLGHAGVDLLRSAAGSVVLEVNSCPDFTSMIPYVEIDLPAMVIEQTLQLAVSSQLCQKPAAGCCGRDRRARMCKLCPIRI